MHSHECLLVSLRVVCVAVHVIAGLVAGRHAAWVMALSYCRAVTLISTIIRTSQVCQCVCSVLD